MVCNCRNYHASTIICIPPKNFTRFALFCSPFVSFFQHLYNLGLGTALFSTFVPIFARSVRSHRHRVSWFQSVYFTFSYVNKNLMFTKCSRLIFWCCLCTRPPCNGGHIIHEYRVLRAHFKGCILDFISPHFSNSGAPSLWQGQFRVTNTQFNIYDYKG